MTDKSLHGKVAVVTGSGSLEGIGFAIAQRLGTSGAKVVLADLPTTALATVEAALSAEGCEVWAMPLDIADEAAVMSFYQAVRSDVGRVDILVNNAASQGHAGDALVGDMDVALWDAVFAVNARGTMMMCKHALPDMLANARGAIVNISSGTAQAGDMFATAYAATKGAINTFTKYVATQYGAQGIRCNAVAPGLVLTGKLQASFPPPMLDVFRGHSLNHELAMADDIAAAVLFLAGDGARMISGQIISVDGGFFAHVPTMPEIARMMAGMPQ